MEVPCGYNKRLRDFDPRLRLRWSCARQSWLLEIQIARRNLSPKLDVGMSHDTIIRRRDGYMLLDEFPPDALPSADRVVHNLQANALERFGLSADPAKAAKQLADYYDQRDAERLAYERRKRFERAGELASDAWDDYMWASKARVALSG